MLAGSLHAGHQSKQLLPRNPTFLKDHDIPHLGLTFRKRAGLIYDEGVNFRERLEGLCVSNKHTRVRPAAHGHRDGHRRCKAQRAGARYDQHRHSRYQRVREARLRAEKDPAEKGQDRDENHGRNKIRRDAIGEALHRRTAALGFADESHDLREHGFAADALRFHDETSAGVQRSARDLIACAFFDRHGFTGYHRFVDGARAFTYRAVDWNTLSWTDAQPVAALHLIEWHVSFRAIRRDQMRLLR